MKTMVGLLGLSFALSSFFVPPAAMAATAQSRCRMVDIDHIQASVSSGKAAWLTEGQFNFARALYIATPPIFWNMPKGDKAVMLDNPGGDGADVVLFIDGEMSCEEMQLGGQTRKLIDDVGAGKITHVGDGL